MQRPLTLTIELVRANNASDPFAFELQTQRYLSRGAAGDFRSSEFFWSPHLLEDLEAVRQPGRDPVLVQRTGEALRRFLSSADWDEHEPTILAATAAGRPVYVTLRFAAAELYALPWELLTIKKTGQHIGELPGVLLNYEWPGIASAPEKPTPRPEHGRVLLAWSAAGGAVPAGEHMTALLRASGASSYPFDPDRDVLPHASYAGLERVLREAAAGAPIAVLHLLCHGGKAGSSFGVVLNSDEGTGATVVDAGRMRQLLAPHAGAVRLVVLSACDSGNSGEIGNQLGSIAQTLHRAGIAAVLSSRFPLSRQGAVAVCQSLYRALMIESRPLEEAVLAARAELARDAERLDWASLQLYSSSWSTNNDDYDNRPLVFRPYRGLLPFLPEHSGFYRGREPEVEEVFSDLAALVRSGLPRFLCIAGASGTGKSSLVLAGVLPRATAEGWHVVQLRPGSEPLQQLSATLSHLPQPSDTPLLLVVDQLEEIFTHTDSAEVRQQFLARLWALACDAGSRISILATLRIDFIGRCGDIVLDSSGLRLDRVAYDDRHRVFLSQIDRARLRAAIEEPARRVGLTLERGLAERIIEDIGDEPGALPLLQHMLDQLWQRRMRDTLTQAAYDELGGVIGALARRADATLKELNERERAAARSLMVRLVNITVDGNAGTRRRVQLRRLRPPGDEPGARFDRVVELLCKERLLVYDGEQAFRTVEIAHEALIRKWQRLQEWYAADRQRLVELEKIEAWTRQWQEQGTLLVGNQLGYAAEVARRYPDDIGPDAGRLLHLSQARVRRRVRFRQGLVGLMVLSVLGFALLAAWGTSRARQAQQAARRARDLTRIAAVREIESDASKAAAILREVENPDPAFVPRWIDLAHRALRESASMAVELWGRQLTFESITLSPDGSQLLSASADGKVYLWPLDGTLEPEALTADDSPLNCAVFSPDGSLIATGAVDGMVRVWQRGQPQPFREYHSHASGIFSLVFSPDGQSLLSASEDGTAQVRDVARPRSGPRVLQHDNAVLGARFSPDGSAVLTWSADGTARLWDPRDGGALAVLRHGSPLSAADFSPDGLYVVTAGDDGTARLWDTRSEALKPQRVLSGHTGPVVAVAFSADSQRIATVSRDHTARTFSVATGDALHVFRHAVSLSRVRWTRSGKLLLTAGEDGHIKLWPADGSRGRISLRGHRDDVNDVLFTLDEKRVISASRDGTARVWDLHESGGMRLLWEAPAPPAHITLSASARWVAAEHEAGVRLYDLGERRLIELSEPRPSDPPDGRADVLGANPHDESALLRLPSVAPPNSPLVSLAFDPSGERLATLRGDGKVRIFRSADGSPLAEVTVPAGSDAVVPSPDGQYLLSARGSLATLIRLGGAGGSSVLLGSHTGAIRRMAVSPDGGWVLTTSYDHSVRAWQPKSPGRPVEFMLHRSPVLAAAFGPAGRLATAGQDGRVLIWSLSRPESAVALQGPSDVISWLAISPDGQHVVAAAQSGTARVWRTDGTGYPIVLSDLESPLQSAQFLPDGKRVVTAASDGTVRSWEVDSDLALLRQRLWQRTPYCMPWEQRVDLFGETDPIAARNESLCRDMQLCLRRPGGEYRRCLAEFTARQERAQQSHQSLLDQLEDLRVKRER